MKLNNKKLKSLFFLSLLNSGLAKEEKSVSKPENQAGISYPNLDWTNSFLKVSANFTEEKITEESNSDQIDIFAGYPISIENQKNCTAGFSVVVSNCQDATKNGFITSSRCCVNCNGVDNILDQSGSLLGSTLYSSLVPPPPPPPPGHDPDPSYHPLDYNYVNTDLPNIDIKPIPYVAGLTTNDKTVSELYSVTSSWNLTELGFTVCAYGTQHSYFCGNLTDVNVGITFFDPIDNSNGSFRGLNQVTMGENDFNFKPGENLNNENLGAPVYLANLYENIGHTTARLLGHITLISNDNWTHKSFYYTPIDTVLQDLGKKTNCVFELVIFNDSNTNEFQAQIEAPLKN